jgi:polyhydroxybutyrate depolymerase
MTDTEPAGAAPEEPAPGTGEPPPAGAETAGQITVAGTERSYQLHLPPDPMSSSLPLVLAFHGWLGTGQAMARLTGLSAHADRRRLAVAYPQGLGRSWNSGTGAGYADRHDVDDVGFVSALIDRLLEEIPVDKSRIYAVGMSNGAVFTHRLGCTIAAQLTGIATVAGSLASRVAEACRPERPLSVLQIHGAADATVPLEGGMIRFNGGEVLSAVDSIRHWARRARCPAAPVSTVLAEGVTSQFARCASGAAIELVVIEEAGHVWPGTSVPQHAPMGKAFDATTYIVDFLLRLSSDAAVLPLHSGEQPAPGPPGSDVSPEPEAAQAAEGTARAADAPDGPH